MGLYAHFNSALFGITFKSVKLKRFFFTICASPIINFSASEYGIFQISETGVIGDDFS